MSVLVASLANPNAYLYNNNNTKALGHINTELNLFTRYVNISVHLIHLVKISQEIHISKLAYHIHTHTHTHTQLFYGTLDSVRDKPHKPVPEETFTHSYLSWSSVIPISSSIYYDPWQSFSTISLQVFFGLPHGLALSTSHSIHFFTQSLSSFHNTCPYHHNLFCCSTEIMSPNPSLSLSTLHLELYLVAEHHTSI